MTEAVKDSIELLSKAFGVPIYIADKEGNRQVSTKIPFFCELAEKKGRILCHECRKRWMLLDEPMITECHAGLTNIVVPLKAADGVLVASSLKRNGMTFGEAAKNIGVDVEDLIDESAKLPSLPQDQMMALAAGLASLGILLPEMAVQSETADREISYNKSLAGFAQLLFSKNEQFNESVNYLAKAFALDDCALLLDNKVLRAKRENAEQLASAERVLWAQVVNGKAALCIRDISRDFLIRSDDLPNWSTIALPIGTQKILGVLIMYRNDPLWVNNLEFMSPFGALLSQALIREEQLRIAQETAVTDGLTELFNKRYFLEALKSEVARASRFQRPTSLIIIDVDNFKSYNDTFGHPDGDVLLKQAGKIIKSQVGTIDVPCRFGGEEFVIILPETKPEHAFMMAEKIRKAVEVHEFANRKVTISVGLITCTNSSISPDTMLKEADKALYKSKKSGKNKTTQVLMVDKNLSPVEGEVTRNNN